MSSRVTTAIPRAGARQAGPGEIVADSDYSARTRFVRFVALANLASQVVPALLLVYWLAEGPNRFLVGMSTSGIFLAGVLSFAALAATRRAPLWVHLVLLAGTWFFGTAAVTLALAPLGEAAPLFVKSCGWVMVAAWFAALWYVTLAGRDFSFLGVAAFAMGSASLMAAGWAFATELTWSEALTAAIVCISLVSYWVFDLAMILRRRRYREEVQAVVDLYRDLLNFVGFPVRLLRIRKRSLREPFTW